jgi:hypothetical protein
MMAPQRPFYSNALQAAGAGSSLTVNACVCPTSSSFPDCVLRFSLEAAYAMEASFSSKGMAAEQITESVQWVLLSSYLLDVPYVS